MIQFAEPDTWEAPSAAPGWWNRDVMAHLAAADTAAAQLQAETAVDELLTRLLARPAGPGGGTA